MDKDARIAELEDTLKQRDQRIADLRAEIQEAQELVREQQEAIDEDKALIERWCESFDMMLDENGKWRWARWIERHNEVFAKYRTLLQEWNKFVGEYNEVVAPKRRNIGRPLQAGPGQVADVRQRRKAGQSIRTIAWDTNLSERTVRSIIAKAEGSDRATLARLERIPPEDRAIVIRERRQARDIAALPSCINAALKTAEDLRKRAKGLG